MLAMANTSRVHQSSPDGDGNFRMNEVRHLDERKCDLVVPTANVILHSFATWNIVENVGEMSLKHQRLLGLDRRWNFGVGLAPSIVRKRERPKRRRMKKKKKKRQVVVEVVERKEREREREKE